MSPNQVDGDFEAAMPLAGDDKGSSAVSESDVSSESGPPIPNPQHRRLRAFQFDPMSTRQSGRTMEVIVSYEADLAPGPSGRLVKVVDYDPVRQKWYCRLDLTDPHLADGGIRLDARDPRCHQQVVYAIAMSVLERFERYLGREFRWWGDSVLTLVPHAFEGPNAYFDPAHNAVFFGYFEADVDKPGPNLPAKPSSRACPPTSSLMR